MRAKNLQSKHTGIKITWVAAALTLLYSIPIMSKGQSQITNSYSLDHRNDAFSFQFRILQNGGEFYLGYSSRSLFKGKFGYGWCSDFDWKVAPRGVFFCGQRRNISAHKKPWGFQMRDQERSLYFNHFGDLVAILLSDERQVVQVGSLPNPLSVLLNGKRKTRLRSGSRNLRFGDIDFHQGNGNLLSVRSLKGLWRQRFDLEYDDFHNLKRVSSSRDGIRGRELRVEYRVHSDQALALSSGQCRHSLVRESLTTLVKRDCIGENEDYGFLYDHIKKQIKSFTKEKSNYELKYDQFGRVIEVDKGRRKLRMRYPRSGRIQRFPEEISYPDNGKLLMEYGPGGNLSRVYPGEDSLEGRKAAREIRGFFNAFIKDYKPILDQAGSLEFGKRGNFE